MKLLQKYLRTHTHTYTYTLHTHRDIVGKIVRGPTTMHLCLCGGLIQDEPQRKRTYSRRCLLSPYRGCKAADTCTTLGIDRKIMSPGWRAPANVQGIYSEGTMTTLGIIRDSNDCTVMNFDCRRHTHRDNVSVFFRLCKLICDVSKVNFHV